MRILIILVILFQEEYYQDLLINLNILMELIKLIEKLFYKN